MRITDELRLFAADPYTGWVPTDKQQADLRAIADRIDEVHERAMAAAALIAGVPMTDENMAEHGWVRMPKDADGEYIRIGDVVTVEMLFDGRSKPLVVDRMELSRGKGGELWCIALDTDKECWNLPSLMRHYHAPTVEDVLREFALKVAGEECMTMRTGVVEEYAEKLREVMAE